MATIDQLKKAFLNAHNAGDKDAAEKLAAAIRSAQEGEPQDLPPAVGDEASWGDNSPEPDATFGEKAAGAGEAALTISTGATSGAAGFVFNALKGLAEEVRAGNLGSQEAASRIEKMAIDGMESLTYAPRTETGQEYVGDIGEALAPLAGAAPLTGELAAISSSARSAAPAANIAAGHINNKIITPVGRKIDGVKSKLNPPEPVQELPPKALERIHQSESLPVPFKLTKGDKTRNLSQQRFEKETAKLPEGQAIRDRMADHTEKFGHNMDAFIDMTESKIATRRGVGEIVDEALKSRSKRDENKINVLYEKARKQGELEEPITLDNFVKYLEENRAEGVVANVIRFANKKSEELGIHSVDGQGGLTAKPVTLERAELMRRAINDSTDDRKINIRQSLLMKREIDGQTEGKGGDMYKAARKARTKYANDYERSGIINRLMSNKNGTKDRAIALEDVLSKVVFQPSASLDALKHVRKILQTEGKLGKQAWREIQGGTIRHIKKQATKGITTDENSNRVVSVGGLDKAITGLDESGKLDFLFSKKGAEQLRVINDVAKYVLTAPPGVVNHSNTATVLLGLVDVAISGTSGIPAPIATSFRLIKNTIKDKKLKSKIAKALE